MEVGQERPWDEGRVEGDEGGNEGGSEGSTLFPL